MFTIRILQLLFLMIICRAIASKLLQCSGVSFFSVLIVLRDTLHGKMLKFSGVSGNRVKSSKSVISSFQVWISVPKLVVIDLTLIAYMTSVNIIDSTIIIEIEISVLLVPACFFHVVLQKQLYREKNPNTI